MNKTDYAEFIFKGCTPYRKKSSLPSRALGLSLVLTSLIVPDAGISAMFGVTLISGVDIKAKAKSIRNELKTRWRLL